MQKNESCSVSLTTSKTRTKPGPVWLLRSRVRGWEVASLEATTTARTRLVGHWGPGSRPPDPGSDQIPVCLYLNTA
jgi:hypothetical protein